MTMLWNRFQGFARILVFCVTVLLVSSGMCGVQLAILSMGSGSTGGSALVSLFMFTGVVELIAIGLSAGAIIVVLIAWAVRTVYFRSTGRSSDGDPGAETVQTLFPRDDDPK